MIGTALAIGLAASAAAQGGSAIMQSRAAGKASKAQQGAANESNRMAGQVYQDQMAMTQPYRQAGTQSVNLLGSLMQPAGAPGGYRPGVPPGGANQFGPPGPPMGGGQPGGLGGMMGGQPPMGGGSAMGGQFGGPAMGGGQMGRLPQPQQRFGPGPAAYGYQIPAWGMAAGNRPPQPGGMRGF